MRSMLLDTRGAGDVAVVALELALQVGLLEGGDGFLLEVRRGRDPVIVT